MMESTQGQSTKEVEISTGIKRMACLEERKVHQAESSSI